MFTIQPAVKSNTLKGELARVINSLQDNQYIAYGDLNYSDCALLMFWRIELQDLQDHNMTGYSLQPILLKGKSVIGLAVSKEDNEILRLVKTRNMTQVEFENTIIEVINQ